MAITEHSIRNEIPGITLAEYKRADAELRAEEGRIGFVAHAIVFVLVNIMLIVINVAFAPIYLWFFFPLISWTIGLSMHYLYGVRWASKMNEEREAKVEYRAKQNLLSAGSQSGFIG